jgi:NACHT domain
MTDGMGRAGVAGLLVAVLVPPAVAAGLGKSFVGQHPARAIVIGVAYFAIAGCVVPIVNALLKRWQPQAVDRLDLFLRRQDPRFERRYCQFVLDGLTKIDQRGQVLIGDFTPALDAVFVDVDLVRSPLMDIRPGPLPNPAKEQDKRFGLRDALGQEKPAVLAVVGAPGIGKTTLLRHAARQGCLRRLSRRHRRGHARDLPILLYLRDHATAIINDPAVSLPALLRTTLTTVGADEPPGWLERKLRDGECLVLLDGLDEVALPGSRRAVAIWAERQIQAYARNDFVVSSRPLGYQAVRVEGADIAKACGFTAGQVTQFIRDWYHEIEIHGLSKSEAKADPGAVERAEARARQRADDLMKILANTPSLFDLAVNPLLLTMMANLHEYLPSLPRTRASLYSEICAVMLGRRRQQMGITSPLGAQEKKAILAGLAYAMMELRVGDLSRADLLTAIAPALERESPDVTPEEFLSDVRSDGLLIERGTDRYAFAHKTFQEYLTAAHIREEGYVSRLSAAVSDDWWAEVTLFYTAQYDAGPIIRAALDADTLPSLALASEVAEQGSDLDPGLRARLDTAITSDALDPGHRRLAGILLSRHLRHRSPVGGGQVCVRPIPAEIYRLFLAATPERDPDSDPAVLQTPAGIAAGVRGGDALAFVTWTNAVMGGQPAYRLPSAAELDRLAAQQRIPALPSGDQPEVWTLSGGEPPGTPRLWQLPPHRPPRQDIDEAALTAAIKEDLVTPVPLLGALLLLRSRIATRLPPALLAMYDHPPGATSDAEPDPTLAVALAPAPDLELALALDLSADLAHRQDIRFEFDPDIALMLALSRQREFDLDKVLNDERKFDLALARALARDNGTDVGWETSLAGGHARRRGTLDPYMREVIEDRLIGEVMPLVMGRALSTALASARRAVAQSELPAHRFATAFANMVGTATAGPLDDPDLIPGTLDEAVEMLGSALPAEPGASWASAVAERLRQNAEPILRRAERPTREKSAAIRLAALCLAAEGDDLQRKDIGDRFRHVAMGITWLQKRACGDLPATEVIMLAVDPP